MKGYKNHLSLFPSLSFLFPEPHREPIFFLSLTCLIIPTNVSRTHSSHMSQIERVSVKDCDDSKQPILWSPVMPGEDYRHHELSHYGRRRR